MGGSASTTNYNNSYEQKYFFGGQPVSVSNSSSNTDCPPVQDPQRQRSDFTVIGDNFNSIEEVKTALREHGLESSNLIVGVDFTKSNEWTGKGSYHGRSLHDLEHPPNPYEQVLKIIGKTLPEYDEDDLIPCFGFGDASTHDEMVFSFKPNEEPCQGFDDVIQQYRQIVRNLKLSGPTSFAPIIETAIRIVENSNGRYHILLVIADGQVTRSVETETGTLSPQEKETIDAIVKASKYALSIVFVGVGDGPWYTMQQFDDNIPARAFDNFQFVNFTEIMSRNINPSRKEADFALAALMEIPFQYEAIKQLKLYGSQGGDIPRRRVLPPPSGLHSSSSAPCITEQNLDSRYDDGIPFDLGSEPSLPPIVPSAPPLSSISPSRSSVSNHLEDTIASIAICHNCNTFANAFVFDCGHRACYNCAKLLTVCPWCETNITRRYDVDDFSL